MGLYDLIVSAVIALAVIGAIVVAIVVIRSQRKRDEQDGRAGGSGRVDVAR